jgi:hypothetical protein
MPDLEDEFLSNNNGIRISTVGVFACYAVGSIVSPRCAAWAVLFETPPAVVAFLTTVDHGADRHEIAGFECRYTHTDRTHSAYNLVPRNAGKDCSLRVDSTVLFAMGCMYIGVANAAERRQLDLQAFVTELSSETQRLIHQTCLTTWAYTAMRFVSHGKRGFSCEYET